MAFQNRQQNFCLSNSHPQSPFLQGTFFLTSSGCFTSAVCVPRLASSSPIPSIVHWSSTVHQKMWLNQQSLVSICTPVFPSLKIGIKIASFITIDSHIEAVYNQNKVGNLLAIKEGDRKSSSGKDGKQGKPKFQVALFLWAINADDIIPDIINQITTIKGWCHYIMTDSLTTSSVHGSKSQIWSLALPSLRRSGFLQNTKDPLLMNPSHLQY